jgi:uncharacterized protein
LQAHRCGRESGHVGDGGCRLPARHRPGTPGSGQRPTLPREKRCRHGPGNAVRVSLADDRRENIIHCIASHRFRGGDAPRTIEASILFDADKLDAIGAVGVARAFLFAGELGARLHSPEVDVARAPAYSIDDTGYREYVVKLSRIRARILTDTGRRLADERHRFMACFFDRFIEEYEGKR